eukprot:s308_g21.t1
MFFMATSFDTPIGFWDVSSLTSHRMFHALQQPCGAGRGPGKNNLMCERCGVGQYAPAQSYCQRCPEGSAPSANRTTCEDCLIMHYSLNGVDECLPCNLPLVLVDNSCVWWHLPLLALGLGALGDEQPDTLDAHSKKLRSLGLRKVNFSQHISAMRALQSQRAGVSIGYLLSADFAQLAIRRTGKDDPTFIDAC